MVVLGTFFIFFGVMILVFPALLAYIIAFFFLFLGLSILSTAFAFRKYDRGWKIGSYEITRRR
jgi:hypothetical protein